MSSNCSKDCWPTLFLFMNNVPSARVSNKHHFCHFCWISYIFNFFSQKEFTSFVELFQAVACCCDLKKCESMPMPRTATDFSATAAKELLQKQTTDVFWCLPLALQMLSEKLVAGIRERGVTQSQLIADHSSFTTSPQRLHDSRRRKDAECRIRDRMALTSFLIREEYANPACGMNVMEQRDDIEGSVDWHFAESTACTTFQFQNNAVFFSYNHLSCSDSHTKIMYRFVV